MTRIGFGRIVLAAVMGVGPAATARAQVAGASPVSIAPAAAPQATRRDVATLTLSTSASSSRGGVSTVLDPTTPVLGPARLSSDAHVGFGYTAQPSQDSAFQFGAGTGVRRQEGLREFLPMTSSVSGVYSTAFGRRVKATANGSYGYSPSYSPLTGGGLMFDDGLSLNPQSIVDYSQIRLSATSWQAGASASTQITTRSTLSMDVQHSDTSFSGDVYPSLTSSTAGAGYRYQLLKSLGLRAGYHRRQAKYFRSGAGEYSVDDLDLGVDFGKGLTVAITRRTTLGFTTGASLVQDYSTTNSSASRRRLHLTGGAQLTHQRGRYTQLSAGYSRAVGFIAGIGTPGFSDSVTAGASTRLAPRLTAQGSWSMLFANDGSSGSDHRYRSTVGSARLSLALTREISIFGDYLYYTHDIGTAVQQIGALPRSDERRAVRVGLSVSLPVMRQWIQPRGEG